MGILIKQESTMVPPEFHKVENSTRRGSVIDIEGKPATDLRTGKAYVVLDEYKKEIACWRYILNIIIGIVAIVLSLGIAYCKSPSVQDLFKKEHSLIVIEERKHTQQASENTVVQPTEAVLFLSMAGNPVHKGHMAMIATAIDGLRAKNVPIEQVFVCLSFESYLKGKVEAINKKREEENSPLPRKVLIPRPKRIEFLKAAIDEAAQESMFKGVPVDFKDDQDQGEADYYHTYARLSAEHPLKRVYYVAGADHYTSQKNTFKRQNVHHAIIITRNHETPKGFMEVDTAEHSRFVFNGPEEYQQYSSSAIQDERRFDLLPVSVREEFAKLHEEAQPKR